MPDTPNLAQTTSLFLQLFRLIKPYHKYIVKGIVAGPIIGLLSIAPPYFTKLLFDKVAENYDVTLMMLLVAGIVAFSITSVISEAVLNYYSSFLNIKLENITQLLFFNHIQHLPFSFFYKRQVGEISSRFQEIKSALGSVHAFLNVVIGQGVYLLIVPPFLFLLNWKLALVALIAVPFSTLAIYWMSNKLRTSWQNVIESHAEVEASQLQMLNQIATVKLLQLERPLYAKTSSQLTKVLDAHMRAQSLTAFLMIFDKSLNVLTIGLFTWLGWHFILQGEMSVGDYVAFAAYIGYLRNPLMQMIDLFTNFQQWAIHLQRIFEYLHLAPEQDPDLVNHLPLVPNQSILQQQLTLQHVSYQYHTGKIALKDISLQVKTGEIVAFIGGSGSGKSTLLRLLTRIEQGHSGDILFDGKAIENIPLSELRSQLGVVWQDVELFQGTLRENFTMGLPAVDQEWLDYIVDVCCLTEFAQTLPQGYDTPVSERGITLSGGQRQRVALVRALVRQTPLLILDEAMSNLDIETEAKIMANLVTHARQQQQTVLLVTHRVSTITLSDCIYIFDEGQILEYGNHAQLMSTSAHYQRLHQLSEDMNR